MKKIFLIIMILTSTLVFAKLKSIKQTLEQNIYRYQVNDYQIIEEDEFCKIENSGLDLTGSVGSPRLPKEILEFIVPMKGTVSVQILDYNSQIINLPKPLEPNEEMVIDKDTYRSVRKIDKQKYLKRAKALEVGELSRYRQYEYFPIIFSPYIYDHQSLTLEVITSIIFQINVSAPKFSGERISDKFTKIYQEKFANYRVANMFGSKRKLEIKSLDFTTSDFWFKIEVAGDGIYFLQDQLAQLPSFVSAEQLSMKKAIQVNGKYEWEEVGVFFENNSSQVVDEKDKLYFENKGAGDVLWLNISAKLNRTKLASIDSGNARRISKFKRKQFSTPQRNNFDSVIIYPSADVFYSQAQQLADFYERNYNLQSLLISQEDIFDNYTGGIEEQLTGQVAIRDTLEACNNSYSNLEYVTLLGSGTRSWSTSTQKNKIMTFLISSGYVSYVSDDSFVDFTPNDGSYIPELSIGRMPAQNNDQMDEMIDRLIEFVETPDSGLWRDNVMFIADDENKEGGYEGMYKDTGNPSGMDHSGTVEGLSELLKESVIVDKIFAFNYGFDEFQNKPEVRDAQVEVINNGCAFWIYVGHGNPIKIGDEDYFCVPDLDLLSNGNKLPIFIAASCSVGKYDDVNVDSISEQMLYLPDGGSIATIAATESTAPGNNRDLMEVLLPLLINDNEPIGKALIMAKAKLDGAAPHLRYNVLGAPVVIPTIPEVAGNFSAIADSLQARETVNISGTIAAATNSGVGLLKVYDSKVNLNYTNYDYHTNQSDEELWEYYSVDYTKDGNAFFSGQTTISNGTFDAQFIVPDDISDGDDGRMLLYYFDELSKKDYICVEVPVDYSSQPIDIEDTIPPKITLKLDSELFQSGDYVSTNPMLLATIEDENGLNVLGEAGHRMLMLVDGKEPVDVTNGFIYNENSATKGKLSWQMSEQTEGNHLLQLIVFDNFNNFELAEAAFVAKSSSKVFIEDMLVYPNPLNSDEGAKFTFLITDNADITISIYTITGKKIKKISKPSTLSGYNEVVWNGKDADQDDLANGTYFYKIRAKQEVGGQLTERIGKLIILE